MRVSSKSSSSPPIVMKKKKKKSFKSLRGAAAYIHTLYIVRPEKNEPCGGNYSRERDDKSYKRDPAQLRAIKIVKTKRTDRGERARAHIYICNNIIIISAPYKRFRLIVGRSELTAKFPEFAPALRIFVLLQFNSRIIYIYIAVCNTRAYCIDMF